jgi:hypothetical protein
MGEGEDGEGEGWEGEDGEGELKVKELGFLIKSAGRTWLGNKWGTLASSQSCGGRCAALCWPDSPPTHAEEQEDTQDFS